MRNSAPLRFIVLVGAMVLVFGACGSLTLAAFDKQQTLSKAPLLNPGNIVHFDLHFLQDFLGVLTTYTDHTGAPFHNAFIFGVATTIAFCFLSMPLALLFGLILALMSRSRRRIIRVPARTYVEFFRNTPLLVQLLAIYTSLLFLPQWFLNAFTAGVATLVLNYAAYECENLRAGLEAVDRGQGEAAEALGLSGWQSLRLVVMPQMIPIIIPPVINDLIYMYKDSSILSLITITELTVRASDLGRHFGFLLWQFYLLAGLIYLALSLPLGRLARSVEARLRRSTFAPKRDLTMLALQVLGVSALVGWVCDVISNAESEGVSFGNALGAIGQIVAATSLSVALVLFIFCTLGLIVYVLGTPLALRGRLSQLPPPVPADTDIVVAPSWQSRPHH